MKRTFSHKRVARKIGQHDDEDEEGAAETQQQGQGPVVKRPPVSGSKTKKPSKLRMSFGQGEADDEDDQGSGSGVITPRKSLGRQAIERNAERKTLRPAISSEQLSFRAGNEDRPSYTKDSLAELKLSTPSTPKDVSTTNTSEEDEQPLPSLDLASKFGASTTSSTSAIPTAAEIREKKERRARLAQEKEFISLTASDSDEERQQQLLLRPKEKYAETRLVRDDEDLAEGFDEYVEDGKIALGRKAEREEKRRKRKEMAEMIAEAENGEGAGDGEDEDESEVERNEAYEAAQTRAGTYGTRHREDEDEERDRPRTPPKITPIPDLPSVLRRMRENLQEMRDVKAAKERRLLELQAEKKEITEREVWIQKQLKEVGERYEKLREEAGMTGEVAVVERGLESFGNTPVPGTPMVVSDEG